MQKEPFIIYLYGALLPETGKSWCGDSRQYSPILEKKVVNKTSL